MDGLYDMHCHILPGIDDGSKDMDETLKMLKIAYDEGIRHIFATPHYHPRRGKSSSDKALQRLQEVQKMMDEQFPGMKVYPGHEIYYCHDILDFVKSGEILKMNNSSYVLVEFSFTDEVRKIKSGLNKFLMNGYSPILAHVERYTELVKDWDAIEELVEAGVYLQVNSASLMGKLGMGTKRFIKKLLKEDMVSFIGTDAHNSKGREPLLKKSAEYIEKKFGVDVAERILYENPQKVIENKMI